jgi:hypothetical protein
MTKSGILRTENLEAALFIDRAVAAPVIADVDNG